MINCCYYKILSLFIFAYLFFGIAHAENLVRTNKDDEKYMWYVDTDTIKFTGDNVDVFERSYYKSEIKDKNGWVEIYTEWHKKYNCGSRTSKRIGTVSYFKPNGGEHLIRLGGGAAKSVQSDSYDMERFIYVCKLVDSNYEAGNNKAYKNKHKDKIRLVKSSGVYEVPIILNDTLRINFIVDSGAADVSISPDVASTLVKTGTVSNNDWLPGMLYKFADGSYAKSRRFIIRRMRIGNTMLSNVSCSIANSVDAPMLLGQSALEKLGSYSIDYSTGHLILD